MNYKLITLPGEGYVSVAEDHGKVLATLKLHVQLHLDHFEIMPENKSLLDWRKLFLSIEKIEGRKGARIYASPTFANGPRMLEIMGFNLPKYPVMVKEY